jgi:hypothetical protein
VQSQGRYSTYNRPLAWLAIDKHEKNGLIGDIKEFFITYGLIEFENLPYVMTMVKAWDISSMAYYRF